MTFTDARGNELPIRPSPTFTRGQRVWHANLGWCTYLLLSWDGTSDVLRDTGDALRITTELLAVTGPDGAGPPPVPPRALARFEEYGLELSG